MSPACIRGRASAILDAVDVCQDSSVHRELLKALLEAPKDELSALGESLYDLGLGLVQIRSRQSPWSMSG